MRDFHELRVWSKAHQLVLEIYKTSAGYPKLAISRQLSAISSQSGDECGQR
jgi:hypothetical protein